jgi:cobalt-zinc-cadmium efflux system protein
MSDDSGRRVPENLDRVFAIGVVLNVAYVLTLVVFGILGHSLALLADAGHNFSDVLALLVAWAASRLTKQPGTPRRTYGWRRTSMMAALFNAIFLLVAVGAITWEALRRFFHQEIVNANVVIWVAAIGVLLNSATALLFAPGRKADLNLRAAFMHIAADAAVSAAVVVAGVAILFMGVARPDGQYRYQHRDCDRHVGFAARIVQSRRGCGAGTCRSCRGAKIFIRAAGGRGRP